MDGVTASSALFHVDFLGDFQIRLDGQAIDELHQPRLQSLFAYLVLHRERPRSRQQLANLFWPDTSEQQARTNLRNLLFQLHAKWPECRTLLKISRDTIQWHPGVRFTVDVEEFDHRLSKAETVFGDSACLIEQLKQAIALYNGDLLLGLYDDWVFPEQERLRRNYQVTLDRLIALLEARRDYAGAISYAQLLLRHDPLREPSYRLLMRLHALDDDLASVKRRYLDCVATLWNELEVEPAPATQTLFNQLSQEKQQTLPSSESNVPPDERSSTPFIGRPREWQLLKTAWHRSIEENPQAVLLTGESGMGKTRLAMEMGTWARRQGVTVAVASCYASEARCAFAPLGRLLRQPPFPKMLNMLEPQWQSDLLGLIPGLHEGQSDHERSPDVLTDWQRAHIFETLARLILQVRQPVLLLLDDLQWCDAETLDWLRYLLRYIREERQKSTEVHHNQPGLLMVGSANSEELGDELPLTAWCFALRQRQQITEIELQPLNRCETAKLISCHRPQPCCC